MTEAEIAAVLAKPTITPDELFQTGVLPVSRNGVYAAINRGEIDVIAIGKKKAIITASLRRKLGLENPR
jgi:hypothetical protein